MSRSYLRAQLFSRRTIGKMIRAWNRAEIAQAEFDYQMEEHHDDFENEDEVWQFIVEDCGMWDHEWEYFKEGFWELLEERNSDDKWFAPPWLVEVDNFGWQKLSGYNVFYFKDVDDALQKIFPDCDWQCNIYEYGEDGLAINNFHHDSWAGHEWYYLKPLYGGVCPNCGNEYFDPYDEREEAARQFVIKYDSCPVCLLTDLWNDELTLYELKAVEAIDTYYLDTGDPDLYCSVPEDESGWADAFVPFVPYGEIDAAYL